MQSSETDLLVTGVSMDVGKLQLPLGAEAIVLRIAAEEILRQDAQELSQWILSNPVGRLATSVSTSESHEVDDNEHETGTRRTIGSENTNEADAATIPSPSSPTTKFMHNFYANIRGLVRKVPSVTFLNDLKVAGLDVTATPSQWRCYSLLAILCATNRWVPTPLDLIQLMHESNPASISTMTQQNCPSKNNSTNASTRASSSISSTQGRCLALHLASQCPQTPAHVMTYLIHQYPQALQKRDVQGKLPLHYACSSREARVETVNVMMDTFSMGANHGDKKGFFPFDWAIRKGAPAAVLDRLTRDFTNVLTKRDSRGQTNLHHACKMKHALYETIEFLVQRAPQCIHILDHGRKSPLQYAALCQPLSVLKLLLSHIPPNTEPVVMDMSGYNLLHYAVLANTTDVVDFLATKFPHMLLEPTQDLDDRIPLHLLLYGRHAFSFVHSKLRISKVLVRHNPASLLVGDGLGQSPLSIAEYLQEADLIAYFREETQKYEKSLSTEAART